MFTFKLYKLNLINSNYINAINDTRNNLGLLWISINQENLQFHFKLENVYLNSIDIREIFLK